MTVSMIARIAMVVVNTKKKGGRNENEVSESQASEVFFPREKAVD